MKIFQEQNFSELRCSILYVFQMCQNYSHLKSTRPVASKSKMVRPGSGCGVCVGVESSFEMGSKWVWLAKNLGTAFHFQSVYATIFPDLTF